MRPCGPRRRSVFPKNDYNPVTHNIMNLRKRFLATLVAIVAISGVAMAQFAIGPRVGINVNSMRFDKSVFDSENRAGFTGGIQAEFTIPIINLGFDASVMYVHRVNSVSNTVTDDMSEVSSAHNFKKRDYIEIPVNLKYKIGLPVIGKVFTPYIFTGPSFAFLASKRAISEAYKNKNVDIAWNFGVGIQLIQHLQIGASYGLGLTNTVETVSGWSGEKIDGKNKYWTVTAAWLF